MIDAIETAMQHIMATKDDLRTEAEGLIQVFGLHQFDGNKGRPNWEKSILGVRLNKGAGHDFYAAWYRSRWFRNSRGGMSPRSETIQKGKKYHHPVRSLKSAAKPWEVDVVLEVEDGLAVIREKMDRLKKAEIQLRNLKKTLLKFQRRDEGERV